MAKALAAKLGYSYIDTGAMYRGVTYMAQEHGIIAEDISVAELIKLLDKLNLDFRYNRDSGQSELFVNNKNVEPFIRKSKVASWVSQVAAISEVRRFLVKEQRTMADVGGW